MSRLGHAAAVIAATGLLAGCAAGPAGATDSATRIRLRHDVATLTAAAAGKNYPAARDALSVLAADLATAQAAGQVSPARLAQLRAAIAAVQADLAAASAASASPSTAAAARTTGATRAPATRASAPPTRAAAITVAPRPAPAPQTKHAKGKKGGKGH